MSDTYILDEQNNAIPVSGEDRRAWQSAIPLDDRTGVGKVIEQEYVDDNLTAHVSTVFLSLDHATPGSDQPILFETLVNGGVFCQDGERYSTYDEAVDGHRRWVQKCQESINK